MTEGQKVIIIEEKSIYFNTKGKIVSINKHGNCLVDVGNNYKVLFAPNELR